MEEGTVRRSDLGTPQGGVISPLLANIYLNYFDRLWEKHGKGVGRTDEVCRRLCGRLQNKKDADMLTNLYAALWSDWN